MTAWCCEYLRMVEDCEKRKSQLTEWERDFIASIRGYIDNEIPLTLKQTDTLDRIWGRATRGG